MRKEMPKSFKKIKFKSNGISLTPCPHKIQSEGCPNLVGSKGCLECLHYLARTLSEDTGDGQVMCMKE